MSLVVELFGHSAEEKQNWQKIVAEQQCPFLGKRCYKVRKSDPETAIGSCTVLYGGEPIVICPARLTGRRQIFADCLHLLTNHAPGNELHILSEISIPGGKLDYVLASVKGNTIRDFVGIELQTLDSTGTVWPERQRLLKELGVPRNDDAEESDKSYGMNWKMTAKTILVQMHHKIQTFEHLNRRMVLVVQDRLLAYMTKQFNFGHLKNPAVVTDSMHFHAYEMAKQEDGSFKLILQSRLSTDAAGIATCLGLQMEARVELEIILKALQSKISERTLFVPV